MKLMVPQRRTFLRKCAALLATGTFGILRFPAAKTATPAEELPAIGGPVIRRSDPRYKSWWANMTWYLFKPKRYPDLIVRAMTEQDVIQAIRYARQNDLRVVTRTTGHNPAKSVLRDGGMLLDLSRMRSVETDPESRTAWIQPGIRSEHLLHAVTRHKLAFPAAHTGIVGLGGYLLGGGIGWNMPEYGIACRSILAAEMVTASGEKIRVSADENRDLLWAVRGAGPGFFGSVIRYKLQLYPLHTAITVNSYVFPVSQLPEILRAFSQIEPVRDRRMEILLKVGRFYPAEKPYIERDLVCTVSIFAFVDSSEEAVEVMKPVAESNLGRLSIQTRENIPVTYKELYIPPATDYSSPGRTIVHNSWTDQPDKFLLALAEKIQTDPPRSPRSFLLMGWSFNFTFDDPDSCIRTDARHYISWYMIAEKEQDIEPNYQWMDESISLTQGFSKGRYINEIDPLRYPQAVLECFSAENWERLMKLRQKYDPSGVFHTYLGHKF